LSIATGQAATAAIAGARRRANVFRRIARHRADYLYVAPALLVMLVVIAYPVWFTIQLSFEKTSASLSLADQVFIGFDNYLVVLRSQAFRDVTVNTVIWTVFSTFFSFVIGFGCALSLNRPFFGRGVMRAVLLIPYVISAVAASYIWRWLMHSDFGVFSAAGMQLGLIDHKINFLDNTQTVLASLIVVNVWKEFSFAMIMLMAGLQTVPDQLLRAAQIDGANTWQRFWHVTFPHLRGVTLVTVLLLLVANLNSFIIPWVMTGGGPAGASDIWITAIYNIAFGKVRFGLASAYSVILFIVMMGLGYFYVRALTGKDDGVPEE
jgi:multiple sugar transport system permease protein